MALIVGYQQGSCLTVSIQDPRVLIMPPSLTTVLNGGEQNCKSSHAPVPVAPLSLSCAF